MTLNPNRRRSTALGLTDRVTVGYFSASPVRHRLDRAIDERLTKAFAVLEREVHRLEANVAGEGGRYAVDRLPQLRADPVSPEFRDFQHASVLIGRTALLPSQIPGSVSTLVPASQRDRTLARTLSAG